MPIFLKRIFFVLFLAACTSQLAAQTIRDSVVQLYGVVMTADSLRGLDGVSVSVKGKGRGTITNYQGVFSIAVLKGDEIEFSFVGFKSKNVTIPVNWQTSTYEIIQLLTSDTNYLPGTIIRARPTRPQFERDFLNNTFSADEYAIARENLENEKRAALMSVIPSDAKEAMNYTMRQKMAASYHTGQLPPMGIMNPFAWSEFIKSWKRGDFKKKK